MKYYLIVQVNDEIFMGFFRILSISTCIKFREKTIISQT